MGDSEGSAIVHLIGDDGAHAGSTIGALDHIAYGASGIGELHARLEHSGIAFRERTVADTGVHQVFVKDPDGVTIELNYADAADVGVCIFSLIGKESVEGVFSAARSCLRRAGR